MFFTPCVKIQQCLLGLTTGNCKKMIKKLIIAHATYAGELEVGKNLC